MSESKIKFKAKFVKKMDGTTYYTLQRSAYGGAYMNCKIDGQPAGVSHTDEQGNAVVSTTLYKFDKAVDLVDKLITKWST